jgi:8-oxo-dGTP pyrophosphatase MutT (NUDIX family)
MNNQPKYHYTAGGVVLDAQRRMLTLERDVKRNGAIVHEVRLPKGHLDPGETDDVAAKREVWEESGYGEVEIVGDLGLERSEFEHQGRKHVRDEHYFIMRLVAAVRTGHPPHPDSEEALFVPSWVDVEDAESLLTYPSEKEFARRTIGWLRAHPECL